MEEQPQGVHREAPADERARLGPGEGRTFDTQPLLAALHTSIGKAYSAQLRRLLTAIGEYMEIAVMRGGTLLFTPADIEHIRALVRDYHLAFVVGAVHPDAAAPQVVQRLIDEGILPQDLAFMHRPQTPRHLPPVRQTLIDTSFEYGRSLGPLREHPAMRAPAPAAEMVLGEFEARRSPPLTPEERGALDWARTSAATHITGLGDRFAGDLATRAVEADRGQRKRYEQLIRDQVALNIEKRQSWRKLASEIGDATGDWSRNLKRIAATESHGAMQAGIAAGLKKREKKEAEDIYVAKQPAPDACADCVRLHLVAGPGSAPRVFKLSELEANGTNVGKKRKGWKAVVGATHPWCGCELIHVPEGWAFDADGNLVPEFMTRAGYLVSDLRKAMDMTYGDAVPERGVVIRVGDPKLREACERIVAITPPEIFDKRVGVTLITTDMPRVQNPLDEHDFAYWTANEIRLMHNLPPEKIERVLPHEIGHSLNVHLMNKFGGVQPVRAWHDKLWAISKEEGFVSDYATKLPIENAAEVSMLYLYNRKRLLLVFPRQFAFVHRDYREVFRKQAAA